MKTLFTPSGIVLCLLIGLSAVRIGAQPCDDLALDFTGNGNAIERDLTTTAVTGNVDFTLEARFFANPTPVFQILFSVQDAAALSYFDIGLLSNGQLAAYWRNTNFTGTIIPVAITTPIPDLTGDCHHLAVSWNSTNAAMLVYLNGVQVATLSTAIGPFQWDKLVVGHTNGGYPAQDWFGAVDEIRLWRSRLPVSQIDAFKDCSLSGSTPDMVFNWTLNQGSSGVVPGGNNAGSVAEDMSGNGLHGTLQNFPLNGPFGNFVCTPCGPRYGISISDMPAQFPVSLSGICSGDDVHFCINDNFTPVGSLSGATVTWEYADGSGSWSNINDPVFSGYCFFVPKGVIDIGGSCATSTTGFVDRYYRAIIEKTMGGLTCRYTSSVASLNICCPPTPTVTLTPQPPLPPGFTLCEGTVTVDVQLNGPPFLSNLPIQWCINGVHDPTFDNLTTFTYSGQANPSTLCFEAKLQNCNCPPATAKACLPVDPLPQCGTVDVIGGPVMPDPDGVAGHYVICPGNAVTLGMMGTFNNCNPVWQYKFDVPGSLWSDLGTGNGQQQSNTLPQTFPPNPSNSPYLWPPGANCILYRVECRPLSYPNSGCMPCHSNEIQICLKPMPPAPVIQSSKNWFCEGGAETMVITNFDINTFYNWYCNGVLTSSSSSSQFNATQPGCYWTSFSDGCYTKTSNTLCFTECEPVAIMKCPEDNPCACYFQPLTFDASMSYSNCGTIVNYQWTAYDAVNNVTVTQNGPSPTFSITFDPTTSPPFTSATISLTVTDVNGCTDDVKPLTIVPCEGP